MRFVLCRAVARCQGRRLLGAVRSAPLPAAIVLVLVAAGPVVLARLGAKLGDELAPALASPGVATALVLGPCLSAAAAGAVIAPSLSRAGLGEQIATSPVRNRAALVAPLVLPALLATAVVLPSLVALTTSLAHSLPGGRPAGLGLVVSMLAAVSFGAVASEGAQVAVRGRRRRLIAFAIGACAWVAIGGATGDVVLGPLSPAGLALEGTVSPWLALASASLVMLGLGAAWIVIASHRPEPRQRSVRRRAGGTVWRSPLAAGVSGVVTRRRDVRLASGAALGFGLTGVALAVVAGSPPPGPFLLATSTTLLGSLVAALALLGILAAGSWLWLTGPSGLTSLAVTAWLVSVGAAMVPVGAVGIVAAIVSGAGPASAGVIAVLVVLGAAVAVMAGSLVPWHGDGIGAQVGTVAAFVAISLATSLAIGLVAPRLTALGLPDFGVALVLCVALSVLATATLARRLGSRAR